MKYLSDALAIAGTASLTVAAAMVSVPLAFAVAGLFSIACAVLVAYARKRG